MAPRQLICTGWSDGAIRVYDLLDPTGSVEAQLTQSRNRFPALPGEREFIVDNLLVRIHFTIVMIWWTGLAPWEFEHLFSGSHTPIYLPRTVKDSGLVEVTQGKKMSRYHLPRVVYHQVYNVY